MRLGAAVVVVAVAAWVGLIAGSGCWWGAHCECRAPGTIEPGRYRIVDGPDLPPSLRGAEVLITRERVTIDTQAGPVELVVVGRAP